MLRVAGSLQHGDRHREPARRTPPRPATPHRARRRAPGLRAPGQDRVHPALPHPTPRAARHPAANSTSTKASTPSKTPSSTATKAASACTSSTARAAAGRGARARLHRDRRPGTPSQMNTKSSNVNAPPAASSTTSSSGGSRQPSTRTSTLNGRYHIRPRPAAAGTSTPAATPVPPTTNAPRQLPLTETPHFCSETRPTPSSATRPDGGRDQRRASASSRGSGHKTTASMRSARPFVSNGAILSGLRWSQNHAGAAAA